MFLDLIIVKFKLHNRNQTTEKCLYFFYSYAAIVSGGKGTAQDKIKTLREAGVTVVESPAKIGAAMLEVFKQRGLAS